MDASTTKKKKPFGFYVCSLGFTFERAAFYTVKYMLAIWIATSVGKGGLGLSDVQAGSMAATFVAMTYIAPVVGGYIADYWISPRLCVAVGMILMALGYLCTWQAHSLPLVWAMIILVSVGTGLFKGNLSGVNGLLFKDEKDLNEAFSVQYSFVNMGSFIGTTFIVLLIASQGFNFVFLICSILMFIDAIWFIFNSRSLGEAGKKPFKVDQRQFTSEATKSSSDETTDDAKTKPLTAGDKKRVVAIVLVTLLSIIFWMAWYMAYMPVYYYFGYGDGADFLNRASWVIGSFKVPTSYFDSVNALVCIALGPVIGKLWTKLAARPKGDMSMFKKTALGIIFMGLAYVVMVFSDMIGNGHASLFWIALVSVLMSIGEMIFSPMGNSFITKLAPAKLMVGPLSIK
ncbi:peptide MFS transporter [Loigolactobacillus bifermentans]|uniref:Transporter, major facilitator family protein n=1 Tax=Loigolactobacillus bifermentans DSM 20003 TaxID=1423726 RepID=A0A0R1H3R7_9LACO|nr:peptide MFS transporter [Loigolactobacillus bifermentans]KRK40649.1 transporter, major facilitator family protein [Loigolactobacillus bifermentans DSM 20003]QGG60677.1 MFS transporter [Loigolactobacillus bifermentans]